MNVKKPAVSMGKLSGGLFCFTAVILLLNLIRMIGYHYFSTHTLMHALSYGFVGVVLFMERRDKLLLIAFAVMALIMLVFGGVITFIAALLLLFVILVATTSYVPKAEQLVKKAWFVPAIVMLLGRLFAINSFSAFIAALAVAAATLLCCMWLAYPDGIEKAETDGAAAEGTAVPAVDGYCELFKHVLLLLLTCGIWLFIWVYRRTKYLNRVEGEEYRNPTTKLLLFMFIPFYATYWTYKSSQRIDKLAASVGVESKIATLCLILCAFVPMLSAVLMQAKINTIIDVETGVRQPEFDPAEKQIQPVGAVSKGTEGYCDLFKHLVLLVLTCGIWNLIWVYKMTKYLNRVEGEPYRNPVTKLLLYMFIPFYAIYWIYKSSQRIDKLAAQAGVESRLSVLCLVLCLVVGLVPQILMQEKINQIIVKETSPAL